MYLIPQSSSSRPSRSAPQPAIAPDLPGGRPEGLIEQALIIPATDGYLLGGTWFHPARETPAPLVVISGATGVPHHFYARFARYLADRGFSVISYDYRGIGTSLHGDIRKLPASLSDWGARDFEGVLRYAKTQLGYRAVSVVGHSVGGQLLGFAESSDMIDRVVSVGAQLGDYRLWPQPTRLKLALIWQVLAPLTLQTFGYLPHWFGVGEALPEGVAREWQRYCTTRGYFIPYLETAQRQRFKRFSAAMLSYSIEGDFFAPLVAVEAWREQFPNAKLVRRHVSDRRLGHFGYFKPQLGGWLWAETESFLRYGPPGSTTSR